MTSSLHHPFTPNHHPNHTFHQPTPPQTTNTRHNVSPYVFSRVDHRDNMMKLTELPLPDYLPPVKPSAIAVGAVFNHAVSLAILGPLFGDTYRKAQAANSSEEFFKSKEAASAAAAWGTSVVGSAIQSYGVGALINATGTLSYKGAAYLGSLIFMASAAPGVRSTRSARDARVVR